MKKVGIVMGSDSDLPIAEKAVGVLLELGIPYEVHVYSAHRTPAMAAEFARRAEERGFGVIIAIAGMAAHLAGSLAAGTTLPVIGIPCKSNTLDGIDALLSTVQMPSGIPVATVESMPLCSRHRCLHSASRSLQHGCVRDGGARLRRSFRRIRISRHGSADKILRLYTCRRHSTAHAADTARWSKTIEKSQKQVINHIQKRRNSDGKERAYL